MSRLTVHGPTLSEQLTLDAVNGSHNDDGAVVASAHQLALGRDVDGRRDEDLLLIDVGSLGICVFTLEETQRQQ